jgi:hypothetical protein
MTPKYLSKNFEGKSECGNRARSKFFSPEPCVPTLRHYGAKLLLKYISAIFGAEANERVMEVTPLDQVPQLRLQACVRSGISRLKA